MQIILRNLSAVCAIFSLITFKHICLITYSSVIVTVVLIAFLNAVLVVFGF